MVYTCSVQEIESRFSRYVAQYSEPSDYDHLKDEQPKLRLPKTAAQTYLPNQKKSVQLTSTVFAYSLSMAGVGRGLPGTDKCLFLSFSCVFHIQKSKNFNLFKISMIFDIKWFMGIFIIKILKNHPQ